MPNIGARDNTYWMERLKKDGRGDLLEQIQAGDLTVYKATQIAGYRSKGARSPAAKLSYHWKRASAEERLKFIAAHPFDIDRVLKEFAAKRMAMKEAKSKESEQK